jgi:hypothetical protein
VARMNENFEYVGYSILGFFGASCLVAVVTYRCCLGESAGEGGREGYGPTARGGGSSIQSADREAAEREAAAKQSAASMDDYLRRRMLGMARGGGNAVAGRGGAVSGRKDGGAAEEKAGGQAVEAAGANRPAPGTKDVAAAAQQLKGGMDDYLRRRMLGLARGSSVQPVLDI